MAQGGAGAQTCIAARAAVPAFSPNAWPFSYPWLAGYLQLPSQHHQYPVARAHL